MARGVELVYWVGESHGEGRCYLRSFTGHQEAVEVLEHLDICIIRAKTNSGSGPIRTPFRFIPNKLPAESERGQ
jgi:hypothetical protein